MNLSATARTVSFLILVTRFMVETVSGQAQIERPFKMAAHGIVVVSLVDARYHATEWGIATHIGQFLNNYSGLFDFDTSMVNSGSGIAVTACQDFLFFRILDGTSSGYLNGGTGRFQNVTGSFSWITEILEIQVDSAAMTLIVEYEYNGSGTITY